MTRIAALLMIALVALAAAASIVPAPASAGEKTLRFKGREHGGVVTFKARKLKGKKVKRLRLNHRGRTKALSRKHRRKLVRRGVLRVRRPKRRTMSPVKPSTGFPEPTAPSAEGVPTPNVPAPAGSPAPAPAPAPAPSTPVKPQLEVVVDVPDTPAPAAPTTSGACPQSEGPFGAGRWPSHCWRPYSDDSPFNREIGPSPRLSPRSADYVAQLTSRGKPQPMPTGNAETEGDWYHPTYYNAPSDPLFTISCVESWGRCPIEGHQIRIPDEARAAGGSDGHMTVVDQASGWEYDFWTVKRKPRGGGTIAIGWGGRTRIDGDGLNSAATAAGFGNLAGIIRAQELAAGDIRHALFLYLPCDSTTWVYPAGKGASHCRDQSNAIPLGTRFQLDMSDAEIARVPGPEWKRTILRAMARYGMYFGDTGGSTWGIQLESGSTYTSFGLTDPAETLARSSGYTTGDGVSWFDFGDGVDWRSRLRALDPCTAKGTC